MIWWLIVVWDCKLLEGNRSILPHCQMTLILLSVAIVFGMNVIWRVQGDCWLSYNCKSEWSYNSVLFFTDPKAWLCTVQLVNECLQQLVIFVHHLYHASFLLDYLVFIWAWFGSCWSQTNREKLCMLLLYVHNTNLRRIYVSSGGWQSGSWCATGILKRGHWKAMNGLVGSGLLSFHNSLNAVISIPQSTVKQSINHILGSDKEGSEMSTVLCTFLWLQDFVNRSQNIYKNKCMYAVMCHC